MRTTTCVESQLIKIIHSSSRISTSNSYDPDHYDTPQLIFFSTAMGISNAFRVSHNDSRSSFLFHKINEMTTE